MLSRLFFLLACIIIGWLIINAVLRKIIAAFGRHRPNEPSQPNSRFDRNAPQPGISRKFDDIKDAEYTDITDNDKRQQ
jgi:hypothetical protein